MEVFVRTFIASYKKQIKEFRRYPNFILKSFFYTPISIILPYFFMMKNFNGSDIQQNNTDIFILLLGVIVWNFVYFSIIETANIVSRELNIGTVETVYTTFGSKTAWLIGSSFAPSSMFFISLSILTYILYLFVRPSIVINYTLLIITIVLTIISTSAMCMITFILNLLLKKIFNTLNFSLDIISIFIGQLYVVSNLPKALSKISYLIPTTYSISLIRTSFNKNFNLDIIKNEIIALIIVTILIMIFSIVIYNIVEKRLMKHGNFLKF